MIANMLCPTCSTPVKPGDRFCSSCGASIAATDQSSAQSPRKQPPSPSPSAVTCTSCGQRNSGDAETCVSCGALLKRKPAERTAASKGGARPQGKRPSALSFFQSWKFTALAALVLVAVIAVIMFTRKSNPHGSGAISPGETGMIQEIEALQKQVDASPNDAPSVLRLANLLQDVRFYPRAIDMYKRYLALEPKNPDARVDLGTTYFTFSFQDTAHRDELIGLAKQEIRQAMQIAPRHQLAFFNYGIIALHSGETDEAMDSFKKCIAIDSTTDAAKRAQEFLTQHTIIN